MRIAIVNDVSVAREALRVLHGEVEHDRLRQRSFDPRVRAALAGAIGGLAVIDHERVERQ